jgi:molybdenum cofactor cytidylyltransferase
MPASPAKTSRVFAIVPAAGRSQRMGKPKQLLDVGGQTMLDALLEPLMASAVAGIALVTHEAIADSLDFPDDSGVFIARNEDEHSEMIDSIRIGLHAWQNRETIVATDGLLVCPADHPGITTSDFDKGIATFRAAPDKIVVATRAGQHGHPIIFPAALKAFVESASCDNGLHALPHEHAERVVTVECASIGVSRDVDTPDDLQSLE